MEDRTNLINTLKVSIKLKIPDRIFNITSNLKLNHIYSIQITRLIRTLGKLLTVNFQQNLSVVNKIAVNK